MHELSICQSLLSQVHQYAVENHAKFVERIIVRVGPLSGIEPNLLAHAFTIAREGTIAAQAELSVEILPIRISCRTCGAESEVEPNCLLCQVCGDWHTQLLSGDEILLASIEMMVSE